MKWIDGRQRNGMRALDCRGVVGLVTSGRYITETLKGSTNGRTKRIVAIAAIMNVHLSTAELSDPLVLAVSNLGIDDNLSLMRGGGGDLFAQGQKARTTAYCSHVNFPFAGAGGSASGASINRSGSAPLAANISLQAGGIGFDRLGPARG